MIMKQGSGPVYHVGDRGDRHDRMWRVWFWVMLCLGFIAVLMYSSSAFAQTERLDPELARQMAQDSTIAPLEVVDALSQAWLNEESLTLLLTLDQEDPQVLWRIARAKVDIGEMLSDEGEAEAMYEEAREYAERSLAIDSTCALAHQTLAIAYGRIALFRGPFSAPGKVKAAHRHALRAVALSDSIPISLYVLGRTHKKLMEKGALVRRLAGLTFAREDSISYYFDRALEVSDGFMIQCHVEYADYLIEEHEEEAAREHLQAALALPLRDEHDAASQEWARELLSELDE